MFPGNMRSLEIYGFYKVTKDRVNYLSIDNHVCNLTLYFNQVRKVICTDPPRDDPLMLYIGLIIDITLSTWRNLHISVCASSSFSSERMSQTNF